MLAKVVSVSLVAAVMGLTALHAQTLDQIGGPKETPPASYQGQTYIDSRGCVFLKAGFGGRTSWVPRVSSNRKVLCGYTPTFAAKPAIEAAPTIAAAAPVIVPQFQPQPKAKPAGAPIDTVASIAALPRTQAVPAVPVSRVPAQSYTAAPLQPAPVATRAAPVVMPLATALATGALGEGKVGCYVSAPVAQRVRTADGGTVVLCTRGDGTLTGALAPRYARVALGNGDRVGAGIYPPTYREAGVARGSGVAAQSTVEYAAAPITIPKGYKLAWTDDRLNPHRARGTATGQAQQDQIWTRTVPARLVGQPVVKKGIFGQRVTVATKSDPARARVSVSSKSSATGPVQASPARATAAVKGTGTYYVQIGTFGVPANAEGVRARLRGAGLPVGTSNISQGGKALEIVLAGPFGDAGQAQAALSSAHASGFGDAFIR